MLLSAEQLHHNYGMKTLLDGVDLHVEEGSKIGIIGRNGTGKSTLLRLLSGRERPDAGKITRDPNVKLAYLLQSPVMDDDRTVWEELFAQIPKEFPDIPAYAAKSMLQKLELTDCEAKVGTLSGGQRRRIALAATLLCPAEVLILDEPTNHLDSGMVEWLEDWLRRFTGGLVMITHDRYFLERVTNRIVELERGKLYFYEANYSKYLEIKASRAEMEVASERKRQSMLRREAEWAMRGARARSTKSRDRLERYEALKNQEGIVAEEEVQLSALSSRLGKKIITLDHVSKAFGEKTVVADFSYAFGRGDRIGILGKNGVGKSTLLNLIANTLSPDAGEIDRGSTVAIGYFSQESAELQPEQQVLDFIRDISNDIETPEGSFSASQMCERFLFDGGMQHSLIGRLSGGEKRRLYLLSVLMAAPNVLLLDEPTNDLDIETLTLLEEYLETFPGVVLAVSHDRYFLDKLAEVIFSVEEGGNLAVYNGNYTDYLEKRGEDAPAKAEKPKAEKKAAPNHSQKKKFSYAEQREYDHIDEELETLGEKLAAIEAALSTERDYQKLETLLADQQATQAALAEKEERWVYLTDLAEQIAAQK